ncbi:SDR family NAD(P)-dependent oxidoreductase, partial [bacterium]|nr:SDR family NAD(P)-dependent oxidoreductase [bacterium]
MNILVTGGAGFIGSHLCDHLIKEGHVVTCLDNLLTGSKENIEHLLNNDNFKFVEHDITNEYDNGPFDQIYNLACPASPIHYVKEPMETIRTNVIGMDNMLKLALKHKAKILQTS